MAVAAATSSCRSTSMVPEKLTREEADLLRRFAELRGETVGTADGGLFSKIKSAFQ